MTHPQSSLLNLTKNARLLLLATFTGFVLIAHSSKAQTLGNTDFSVPALAPGVFFEFAPPGGSGQPWAFVAAASGIANDYGGDPRTSYMVSDPNYTGQYAFLQLAGGGTGSISQVVTFTSAGNYSISFSAAGRVPSWAGSGGNLRYSVEVAPIAGGTKVLSVTDTSADSQPFTRETHDFMIPALGDYLISFTALSGYGEYGDNTALITDVSVSNLAVRVVVDTQPQDQTVPVGSNAAFTVTASGTPPLSYQWLFNGSPIGGATMNSYIITNVQPADGATYSVIVSNAAGATNSTGAVLTVQEFAHAALATATVVNGYVVGYTVTDGGYGYTNTPTVRIIGGGGTGAQAAAVVSNGLVIAVSPVNPGSGYTNTPVVVIAPPFIEPPTIGIAALSLLSFTNLAVGTYYQLQSGLGGTLTNIGLPFRATNTTFTQYVSGTVGPNEYRLAKEPVPPQATATPIVVNGFVVGIIVTSGGSGYPPPRRAPRRDHQWKRQQRHGHRPSERGGCCFHEQSHQPGQRLHRRLRYHRAASGNGSVAECDASDGTGFGKPFALRQLPTGICPGCEWRVE